VVELALPESEEDEEVASVLLEALEVEAELESPFVPLVAPSEVELPDAPLPLRR